MEPEKKRGLEKSRTHSGEQPGDSHIAPIDTRSPDGPGMRILSRYSVAIKNLLKVVGIE